MNISSGHHNIIRFVSSEPPSLIDGRPWQLGKRNEVHIIFLPSYADRRHTPNNPTSFSKLPQALPNHDAARHLHLPSAAPRAATIERRRRTFLPIDPHPNPPDEVPCTSAIHLHLHLHIHLCFDITSSRLSPLRQSSGMTPKSVDYGGIALGGVEWSGADARLDCFCLIATRFANAPSPRPDCRPGISGMCRVRAFIV